MISDEYWRIMDCADDMEWAVFAYWGAAAAAGQAYAGAVFCSHDGMWPAKEHTPRIAAALDLCGIKMWELFEVDNSAFTRPCPRSLGLRPRALESDSRSLLHRLQRASH